MLYRESTIAEQCAANQVLVAIVSACIAMYNDEGLRTIIHYYNSQ